jgi:NhaP-type Na+/H+ or K+/H+ antiporter
MLKPLSSEVTLYALLSLIVIRMLPEALSLLRTHLHGVSVLFAGWFGPQGLASIVLCLIVVERSPAYEDFNCQPPWAVEESHPIEQ